MLVRQSRNCMLATLLALIPFWPTIAQEIPSALPSIGRPLDIRDVKNITAAEDRIVVTASHVYQTATQFFDGEGSRQDLPLNQAIRRVAIPIFATYGLSERLSIGAGTTVHNDLERKLAVFNFVSGATLIGQSLPTGSVSSIEVSGDGIGDLNLQLQYQADLFDEGLVSLVTLDVTAPTAESNPASGLDLRVGQGYWAYRLSYSAVRDNFPMVYFLKATYEENRPHSGVTAGGTPFSFDPGDGFDYTLGSSYSIGEEFTLQALIVGSWKQEGSRNGLAGATPHVRSLHFRPGYSFTRGDLTLTQQISVPVSGRNVLSTNGVLTTLEYRF